MSPLDTASNDSEGHKPRVPRFVIGAFLFVTAAGLLVLWSNHRGQSAWEKYRSELEAQGEKLDWRAWLPPSPPDEENFAATPLLKAIGIRGKSDATVHGRFRALPVYGALDDTGDFTKGDRADLKAVQTMLRSPTSGYSPPTLPQDPAADVLEAMKAVEADLNELRVAATRPYAQLNLRFTDPISMDVPNFVALRELAQILDLKAVAEMRLGDADDSLADTRVILRLAEAANSSPALYFAMFRCGICRLAIQPFWEGWVTGRWSDQQLLEFQKLFENIDLLVAYDTAMRGGERAAMNYVMDNFSHQRISSLFGTGDGWESRVIDLSTRFGGMRQQTQLKYNQLLDESVFPNYDAREQRVYPRRSEAIAKHAIEALSYTTPFNYLARSAMPNTSRALQIVALNQTYVNLALIACALERHRRTNGRYPDSLPELTPQFAKSLPHDLITGQSLKYRRTDDDRFLLYSIGWDEKDDGGLNDENKGDWVWPVQVKK